MRKLLPAGTNIAGQVDIIKNRFDDRNTLRLTFPTSHSPTPSSCFHKCLSQCFDYGLGTGGTFGWVATEHSLYCNCRHHHHHQQGNTSWIVYRVGGEGLRAAGRKLVYCVYSSCGNIRSKPNPNLLFDKTRYDIIVISVPVSSGSDCGDAKELGEERPQTGNGVEVFTSSIVPV